jgi:SAM-dependent methyltransferase
MNFEKEYYEYDGFWSDHDTLYKNNIEKINISFEFIRDDVKTMLDAACGSGIFTNMLVEKYPEIKVTAFDRSEAALKYVKATKLVADINQIPFADKQFDCVVAHDVIEHLPVGIYEQALAELARVAKKYIIIGVPNDEKVQEHFSECPSCKSRFNYDLHMRSFSKDKMKSLFSSHGFACREIRTCDKNTFYAGQQWYSRNFASEFKYKFRSPICPVCGYSEINAEDYKNSIPQKEDIVRADKSMTGLIKNVIKSIWPKYSHDYEMVALFEKTN